MKRTRLSLYYLTTYLISIELVLVLVPTQTLRLMGSTGHYGAEFPRLAGMLMSGLGFNIAGTIRARAETLYPATLNLLPQCTNPGHETDHLVGFITSALSDRG